MLNFYFILFYQKNLVKGGRFKDDETDTIVENFLPWVLITNKYWNDTPLRMSSCILYFVSSLSYQINSLAWTLQKKTMNLNVYFIWTVFSYALEILNSLVWPKGEKTS